MFLLTTITLYFRSSVETPSYPAIPSPTPIEITSFETCAEAGYPVAESYPRQCIVPNGPNFTEDISEPNDEDGLVFCTQDAKICPDGSGVGRIGPDCEFAPCPGE